MSGITFIFHFPAGYEHARVRLSFRILRAVSWSDTKQNRENKGNRRHESGFLARTSPRAGVTAKHTPAYATTDGTRWQVYTKKM